VTQLTIDALKGLTPTGLPKADTGNTNRAAGSGPGFADALGRVVQAVESTESQANTAVTGMLSGRTDVHDAMIALQRAEMSLELTVQVRNKLVQAYQDIMRMPI
jgi:flagellar hook-basal body complex protein FliE